jgi:hypothetical protein
MAPNGYRTGGPTRTPSPSVSNALWALGEAPTANVTPPTPWVPTKYWKLRIPDLDRAVPDVIVCDRHRRTSSRMLRARSMSSLLL